MQFETLFAQHYAKLARVIYRVVGDTARAEELAADTFVRLRRRPPDDGNAAAGWLYRTAMHLAFDELRRKKTAERLGPQRMESGDFRKEVELADERRRVRAVLAAMSSEQSGLLLLRAEGYSYAEIASMTGVNAASVGTYLVRAGEEFRKEYVNRYGELG